MLDFLKRVLNAQIVLTIAGMLLPSIMLNVGLIPAEIWKDVFLGCFTVFVAGGFLKEGLTAFAARGQP